MKIKCFELTHIKAFKSLKFDLESTSVLIGQNDHGKSSILKVIDVVLNQLPQETLESGTLHPDLAERLLPVFPVNAKARRITIYYENEGKEKALHITVRLDLTFTVLEEIERNAKTTPQSLNVFAKIREHNKFILIPALRDASSKEFSELFGRMLREHGLAKIIPQKAGGTPKEYRVLKGIRDDITKNIGGYINNALMPEIEKHFGFKTQHKLGLKFDVDVQNVGEWIIDNLRLGFRVGDNEDATLALSEAGSGVQSGVLLALHRLEQKAADNPNTQFILAVEEPEAFLHPQRQKELYQDILAAQSNNLRVIVTTHSPYIVSETPFTKLGLVKKDGQYASLFVPSIGSQKDREMFDAYSDDVNSQLFFAEKIVLVEGESDSRVLKVLLQKKLGNAAHRISVISASGNANFSPFLRMIRAWKEAKIPHLVVTDFDSLTTSTQRAILAGAKAAGYFFAGESALHSVIDGALDKDEQHFRDAANEAEKQLKSAGLNTFIFTSDLEYALITPDNKDDAAKEMATCSLDDKDYTKGYDLNQLRKIIGSKLLTNSKNDSALLKKPFVHRKIAATIELPTAHSDFGRLIAAIEAL